MVSIPIKISRSNFANSKVSSITWLENHVFLVVHTPSSFDNSQAPQSTFHVITRQPPANFIFQKISDPAGPFGLNRSPPHHFMLRLKDFPPNLQDVILVASTASIDIGLFSRSKVPLTNDKPADKISGVFTMTEMSDDSRRAQLPMTGELTDTSPIGFALDLSSKDKVPKPIPADEMDESPTPLPALMVLNNEGVLASWWVIYSESIRQGTVYPGLVIAGSASQPTQPSSAPTQAPVSAFSATAKPAFGAPAFGSTAPAFGSTTSSTFGAPSLPGATGGAFGGPSALGKSQSPWGTPAASSAPSTNTFGTFGSTPSAAASKPAFGTPSFGTTSTPSFGLGNRASPWATGGSTAPNAAFGQAGGLAKPASVFGAPASTTSTPAPSSGFAAFASKGGFAAAGAAASPAGSIFGSKSASDAFGSPIADSPMDKGSIFGGAANKADSKPAFGSSGFVLGSTFKADPNTKDDISETPNEPKTSFFEGGFSNALSESSKSASVEAPVSKETEMDSDDTFKPDLPVKAETTTPASTPAAPKPQFFGSATPASGLFGTPAISSPPTAKPVSTGFSFGQQTTDTPKPAGFSFASLNVPSSSIPKTPTTTGPVSSSTPAMTPSSPQIKQEPRPETPPLNKKISEAPLPPDSTSKTSYAAGESSASSVEPDAPLPPDFIPKTAARSTQPPGSPIPKNAAEKPIPAKITPPVDVPGGPDDEGDDDSDFVTEDEGEEESEEPSEEGSGEDITKDLSPSSEANQTPGFTPQSSFGGTKNRGPERDMFTKVTKPGEAQAQRSLFGEIGSSAPMLPPPRVQQSPRSPSPVRTAVPPRMRPDTSRSVSAPGAASQASQILEAQRISSRPTILTQKPQAISQEEVDQQAEAKRRADIRARKEAEQTQTLVDADDDKTQEFLASDLKVTTTLDEFVAHSDYVGDKSMESIPAQVETVYRDINSMIDTLGVNARALKCFIQGHTELYKDEGRTIEDLELGDDKEGWCLVEVEDLSNMVDIKLARELENSRVVELAAKLETCNDLQKDLIRLRAKHEDIKKIMDNYQDPSHLVIARAQPLSAEQAAQQHDLRRNFTKFQKLLSEAEEGLTVLKAKVVSQVTSNGKANGSAGPTVEAVMRTITKMTSMAEKRSGDIDVLEGQMRRLRFNSTMSAGSREGSPFATPQNNRVSLRNPGTSSTYGLFYTPDSIKDTPQRFQNSLMSSIGSQSRNSPPRRKLSGYTPEEKAQLKMKLARKKEVTNKLRAALQKAGTNVRLMDDDE